jgi:hypothetical protein
MEGTYFVKLTYLDIVRARLRWARRLHVWPWQVPWQVVLIGEERPPERVFEYFRRLHGLDEEQS